MVTQLVCSGRGKCYCYVVRLQKDQAAYLYGFTLFNSLSQNMLGTRKYSSSLLISSSPPAVSYVAL